MAKIYILTPLFNIQSQSENYLNSSLIIEVSENRISAVVLDVISNTFTDVVVYPVNNNIAEIINNENIFKNSYQQVNVIYNFDESILTPPQYYKREHNAEMLNLMFGDKINMDVSSDFITKLNIYNAYRIPKNVKQCFINKFSALNFTHAWSLLSVCKQNNQNLVYAIFYEKKCTIVLYNNTELVLVKNISFKSPEDAAYLLLLACNLNNLSVENLNLIVSGMIEEKSVLFSTLHNYFLNIATDNFFDKFNYAAEIKVYPEHFFNHLFLMASCV